jgi:alpha-L-fucosidase
MKHSLKHKFPYSGKLPYLRKKGYHKTANHMTRHILLAAIMVTIVSGKAYSQQNDLRQWYDNKYSMFIHFGVYSEMGGVWKGQPVTVGYSEQIQAHGGIMSDVYEEFATTFNPEKWNADSIAILAKEAGMRSIVITSKHHDGFCIYHSKHTPFNIVDTTPFKRDILKELAEACARHGLNMGLYFSLIDWRLHPWTTHNANLITPDHHQFNLNQITELLTGYGPISELWFDMGSLTEQQSQDLYDLVKKLQPGCMVSGRLGNNRYDFCVMGDNEYPDYKIDAPWQTPASIFHETWGYRSWQKREDVEGKTREKLVSLLKVVSRGGNYLLNIGPKGDGTVVPYEARVLKGIGDWLKRNGDAVYGTTANPFPDYYPWGEITASDTKVYLILSGERTGSIELPVLSGKILRAHVLNNQQMQVPFRNRRNSVTLNLPAAIYSNPEIQVIAVEFSPDFKPAPGMITDARLTWLGYENATKHYSYSTIDYYNNHRSVVRQSWNFTGTRGTVTPEIYFTEGEAGRKLELAWDGEKEIIKLESGEKIPLNPSAATRNMANRYTLGPVRSSFDRVHGAVGQPIDVNLPWGRNLKWEQSKSHTPGMVEKFGSRPRESFYVLQEIEASADHDYLIKIYSGDAVQVWLNGELLVMHNNPRDSRLSPDMVLLPLKSGINQLLVKFYNRYGNESEFKTDTNPEQFIYYLKLTPRAFNRRDLNSLEMKIHDPVTPHDPIRLNNIRIEL